MNSICTDPLTIDGTVMVELETIAKALGAKVTENAKTGVVSVKSGRTTITLKVDSVNLTVSRKITKMKQPLTRIDGKLYIPLNNLASALGAKVTTNKIAKTITVTK